jgi:hypothetical protein
MSPAKYCESIQYLLLKFLTMPTFNLLPVGIQVHVMFLFLFYSVFLFFQGSFCRLFLPISLPHHKPLTNPIQPSVLLQLPTISTLLEIHPDSYLASNTSNPPYVFSGTSNTLSRYPLDETSFQPQNNRAGCLGKPRFFFGL